MNPYYKIGWLLSRFLGRLFWSFRAEGLEHVPATGGLIIASNHRSYADPPLVGAAIQRQLFFFAKAELFKMPVLGWFVRRLNVLPIKRQRYDREGIERALEVLRAGNGLVVFPEGTRCRTDDFLPPKSGIGWLAGEAKVPVVPAYIENSNHLWRALFDRHMPDELSFLCPECQSYVEMELPAMAAAYIPDPTASTLPPTYLGG